MGAPSKFTEARRKAILEAIRKGHTPMSAARLAGVDHHTLARWRQRGEASTRGVYATFARDLDIARAKADDHAIQSISDAIPDDWRAAIAFLERRDPDGWGKKDRREVTGPEGEPIQIQVTWPVSVPDAPTLRAVVDG